MESSMVMESKLILKMIRNMQGLLRREKRQAISQYKRVNKIMKDKFSLAYITEKGN